MKHQRQDKVDELLRRATADLDNFAEHGVTNENLEVDVPLALANIALAQALMQYEMTYPSRPEVPSLPVLRRD